MTTTHSFFISSNKLCCRIKSSALSSGKITVPVINNGSGIYEHTFIATSTGIHFIQVIVNGEEMSDISPILLSIGEPKFVIMFYDCLFEPF